MQQHGPGVHTCRGLTLIEWIVVVAIIIVVVVICLTMRSSRHGSAYAKQLKDATQLKAIHQSWIVFSNEFNGIYPTPGLADRLPFNGVETPGRGEEDVSKNTTANLFSMLISNNYITLDICVSPTEPSAKVVVMKKDDYNFKAYNPAAGVLWDANFKADLSSGSNVSYAHLPLLGEGKLTQWRFTNDASFAIIGNRGPRDGNDPDSITFKIHKPFDHWSGNVIFNDGSRMFFDAAGETNILGLFKLPVPHLGFTKSIAPDGQSAEFDWD